MRRLSPTLIALAGLLLSVAGMFVAHQICELARPRMIRRQAVHQLDSVQANWEKDLTLVGELAGQLANEAELTPQRFTELVSREADKASFYSVEWAPRVGPEQREAFTGRLRNRLGRDVRVLSERDLDGPPLPADCVVMPVEFVHPATPLLNNIVGVQRAERPAMGAAKAELRPKLTPPGQTFFAHDRGRMGVFAAGYDDQQQFRGVLLVTLSSDLDSADSPPGADQISLQHQGLAPVYVQQSPGAGETSLDLKLADLSFADTRDIGGQRFRISGRLTDPPSILAALAPWCVFFGGIVLTGLASQEKCQRRLSELSELNERLHREGQRRESTLSFLLAVLDFRDQERDHIAHEIHDGFVQDVIGAQMFVQAMLPRTQHDDTLHEQAERVAQLLASAIDEARRTIGDLKPRVVDEVGLTMALQAAFVDDRKKYGFETNLHHTADFPRLWVRAERMLFRIIRESVNNVRKHAGVDIADVWLAVDGNHVVVEVVDRGKGFNPAEVDAKCFGLEGMRERARFLKGNLQVTSSEKGTKVTIRVPLDAGVEFHEMSRDGLLTPATADSESELRRKQVDYLQVVHREQLPTGGQQ